MREIPLLYTDLVAVVDDSDHDLVSQYKWYALTVRGRVTYAVNGDTFMHRLVMEPTELQHVDHVDHNGLNNQRSNLRYATHQQNLAGCRKRLGASSQYKGVSWSKQSQKWHAQIRVGDKRIHIGLYDNEEEAASAYDSVAYQHHGEFAYQNFPKTHNRTTHC